MFFYSDIWILETGIFHMIGKCVIYAWDEVVLFSIIWRRFGQKHSLSQSDRAGLILWTLILVDFLASSFIIRVTLGFITLRINIVGSFGSLGTSDLPLFFCSLSSFFTHAFIPGRSSSHVRRDNCVTHFMSAALPCAASYRLYLCLWISPRYSRGYERLRALTNCNSESCKLQCFLCWFYTGKNSVNSIIIRVENGIIQPPDSLDRQHFIKKI
jgi:hypothetical protein